jgi:hypothetical protein
MNGNPFTANFIGSTGQYPIYDYIKTTSNVLQYNSSNFTKIKIDSLSNSVYTEINSIKATDASQNSQISAVEASATASANALVAQGVRITNIETWETAQTAATTANTTAIATLNNTKLDKTSLDGGSVIYKDSANYIQLSYDITTFKDVAIFGTNRRLLTLSDTYYNLTNSKQDKITWSSPLSYDTATNTASIGLSNYLTSNVLSNVSVNYGFLHSNILSNFVYPYISSNVLSNITSFYVSSNVLSNVASFYVSSNVLTNVASSYVSSNVLNNVLIPYKPLWSNINDDNYIYYNKGRVGINTNYAYFLLDVNGDLHAKTIYQNNVSLSNLYLSLGGGTVLNKLIVDAVDSTTTVLPQSMFQVSKNMYVRKNYVYDNTSSELGDTIELRAGRPAHICSIGLGVDVNLYSQTGSIGLTAQTITLDGRLTSLNTIIAPNLINKSPFIIDASTSIVINGISGLYKYDLDLRQYTGFFSTAEGYSIRHFKISTFYSTPSKYYNSVYANSYCFTQTITLTNSGGLTFYSPYTLGGTFGEFIGNDNYWMRNSFNYITFIHGHITDISNSNKKWYVIIEDLIS